MGFSLGDIAGSVGAAFGLPFVGSTALALGGDIIGGIAQHDTNQTNQAIANQANQTTLQMAQQNIDLEKQFAQNGISWRIADAAKNGIAPLAALGAAEPSFSPVSAVMATPSYTSPLNSVASGFNNIGQNVSRALSSMQTPAQRANDALDLAYKAKQNDLLDIQIANARLNLASNSHPGLPLAYKNAVNADGTVSVYPSEGISSHNEMFGPTLWSIHNGMIPSIQNFPSSTNMAPRASSATWRWGD